MLVSFEVDRELCRQSIPTTGDGEEVCLPGDDIEHASYGDAGQ